MDLKREFSWSCSRHRCFNFCRTAYHLRYSASWDGWNKFSDKRTRLIYSLKNLRTVNSWTSQVFRETIRKVYVEANSGNPAFNVANLRKSTLWRLKNDWHDITAGDSPDNQKRQGLVEIFYGSENPETVFNLAVEMTFDNIARLAGNGLLEEIARIPYSGFKDDRNPVSFFMDDLKIWLAPDFIFTDDKGLNLFNFFCGHGISDSSWPHVAGINVIYAGEKFRIPEEKINSRSIFIGDSQPGCLSVYAYGNTSELRNIINDSTMEMLEFENNSLEPSKPEASDKCLNCEFRGFCHG